MCFWEETVVSEISTFRGHNSAMPQMLREEMVIELSEV